MIKIRLWLYQGNYRDTINLSLLQAYNIKAMLHLADNVRQPNIETLYLPIEDGESIPTHYIKQGIDFVLQHRPGPVLIACGAGISRSTTFTAAILKITEKIALKTALHEIYNIYPDAQSHPAVWQSMCDYFGEPFDIDDALRH